MRTAPGEKRDFLWMRAVRQINPIILKKKTLQKAPTNKPKPTKQKAIYHSHETPSKTLFTPILLLSPYHGRNKRQISCRTEREPDLMLWGEEILIKKWHLRSRRQREENAMGNGGERIKAVEQRQLLAKFSSLQSGLCGLWWCFSTWEWKASPTSGRCHQLRSSGQLRRTNQCRIYPWQGQSGKKEIWIFFLTWMFSELMSFSSGRFLLRSFRDHYEEINTDFT